MPKLVEELSSIQKMWLYEHQKMKDDEPIERQWRDGGSTASGGGGRPLATRPIFRSRASRGDSGSPPPSPPPPPPPPPHHSQHSQHTLHHSNYNSHAPPPHQQRGEYPHHYPHYPPPYHHPYALSGPGGRSYKYVDPRTSSSSSEEEHNYDSGTSPVMYPRGKRRDFHHDRPNFPHQGEKITWDQSFENLKTYKEFYGDCKVPQKYKWNNKLGGWVNKQRKRYKNPEKYGRITPEQIEKLNGISFKW